MMIFKKEGQVTSLNSIVTRLLLLATLTVFISNAAIAQSQYKLHIVAEIPEQRQTNWLGLPTRVDFVVRWELYDVRDGKLESGDADDLEYKVYMAQDDSAFQNATPVNVKGERQHIFKGNEVNRQYYFKVDGLKEGQVVVQSDVIWAIGGRGQRAAGGGESVKEDDNQFPVPLFFPVAELFELAGRKVHVYSTSSLLGKLSFTMVCYFFIIGIFLIFKKCMPNLSLAKLFPISHTSRRKLFTRKQTIYNNYPSPRFVFFIDAWKKVVTKSHDKGMDAKVGNKGETEDLHFNYFKKFAWPALDVLSDLLKFDPRKDEKNALVEKLVSHFGPEGEFGNLMNEKIGVGTMYENANLNWNDVERELIDRKAKPLDEYPTIKILSAGLQNHIVNGVSWQKVSEEVDRAVQNRMDSEIENLHSNSAVEWLWNMGAMAPLLGLFGTITGISRVFENINKNMTAEITQAKLINLLSGGIFEALYTTIYGLIVGIILMLLYYGYKNDLEWIKNQWQSIYVLITEKM
ncbi:MotA/TolQ/ExbB proton channel family protein [candidate division KSB1 bacterium]|nr:MotA/TolQ/ExbB proton channel family protein [candidate division KSB1 bacterium]